MPDGTTYMLYKSRSYANTTLQIGVARAPRPDGPFERICEEPIFSLENPDFHLEDPYLWYEDNKFRLLIKDDLKTRAAASAGNGVQDYMVRVMTAFTGHLRTVRKHTAERLHGMTARRQRNVI